MPWPQSSSYTQNSDVPFLFLKARRYRTQVAVWLETVISMWAPRAEVPRQVTVPLAANLSTYPQAVPPPRPHPLPLFRRLCYIPSELPGWVKNRSAFWLTFRPARAPVRAAASIPSRTVHPRVGGETSATTPSATLNRNSLADGHPADAAGARWPWPGSPGRTETGSDRALRDAALRVADLQQMAHAVAVVGAAAMPHLAAKDYHVARVAEDALLLAPARRGRMGEAARLWRRRMPTPTTPLRSEAAARPRTVEACASRLSRPRLILRVGGGTTQA